MNSDAAKEILSAYRSSGQDGTDPIFYDALNRLEEDSDLKKWFEGQLELDGAIQDGLGTIRPPLDLEAKILARIRREKLRRISLAPLWLAAAACLLLGGLAVFYSTYPGRSGRLQEFRADALAIVSVQGGPILDFKTPQLSETQNYLRDHQAPFEPGQALPFQLRSIETAGCRAFLWKRYPASLTCFLLPDGHLLHLIAIDEEAMQTANMPVGVQSIGDWHIVFQRKNGMLLMWATQAPMERLKELLVSGRDGVLRGNNYRSCNSEI
jgi:hypothetical protein